METQYKPLEDVKPGDIGIDYHGLPVTIIATAKGYEAAKENPEFNSVVELLAVNLEDVAFEIDMGELGEDVELVLVSLEDGDVEKTIFGYGPDGVTVPIDNKS